MLWNPNLRYIQAPYKSEAELEETIQTVKGQLFGPSRVYLDTKRRIGPKGGKQNIPDGYLIDLSSDKQPVLYVVEVELERHEPLRHVAVQILEFSLAFESEPQRVKRVVRQALESADLEMHRCEEYARRNGFENVDYLLEHMIHGGEFAALVIIDELVDDLETVLISRFKFAVEVIELTRYQDKAGEYLYQFKPFLSDVGGDLWGKKSQLDRSEIDTIVVPAREEGFQEVFLGEDRWYQIRINGSMIPRIKYIAAYVTSPVSAITHIAEVASIEPWKDSSKYVVNFAEPAKKLKPIKLVRKGKVKGPQAPRYTSFERLQSASNLDHVF